MPDSQCVSPDPQEPTFEQALETLEVIVRELEDGRIGLVESLARYEAGVKLLKQCYALLERAERRIELLNRADERGVAETEPFDDQVISLEDKAQVRGRRRSKKSPAPEPGEDVAESRNDIDETGKLF